MIRIQVTDHDISEGQCKTAAKCPIALAVSRELGIPVHISGPISSTLYVCLDRTRALPHILFTLPLTVSKWIEDFDEGKSVTPFHFEVELNK